MARIPDPSEFSRIWRGIPAGDRKRIVRAVNRGTLLEDRKEAALAVVLARRQQKFWRRAWMFAPVISLLVSLFIDTGDSIIQLGANILLGASVLVGMSVYFLRRARTAEDKNHDHAVHGRKRSKPDDQDAPKGRRGRRS